MTSMRIYGGRTELRDITFRTTSDSKQVLITPTSTLLGASLTLTLPNISGTSDNLVSRTSTDTLTNKTLTSPVISTIVNTGTLTLPTSTDTLVGRATTDTLTNKTLNGNNNTFSNIDITALKTVLADASKFILRDASGVIVSSNTVPAGTVVGTSDTQSLTNKTLDNTNTVTLFDNKFTLQDNGDATKQAVFELSGITTGNTRTLTVPNASTTIVGTDVSQTLSNKTLNNTNVITVLASTLTIQDNSDNTKQARFVASGITTGTTRSFTFPDADATLVGTTISQTLANKTINDTNTIAVKTTLLSIEDATDTSKVAKFNAASITTGTTRTYIFPDANTTFVGTGVTQTLTNKTIDGASNTITNVSLTAGVTGVLPIANGGTNSSTSLNNNRVIQSSGGAIVEAAAITAARALISDANGIPTHSSVTSTELGYVSGVTSAIQTQINGKQSNIITTRGDLIYGNASNVAARLAIGASGTVLSSDGTDVSWSTPAGTGDVTAAANIADNRLVRGDGGAKGIQQSGITVDDSNNITGVAALTMSGDLTVDTNTLYVDSTNNFIGSGLTSPAARLHLDSGNATASALKFTAGTTTGQLSTDGFDVGITTAGDAELRQRESLAINIYTANTLGGSLSSAGAWTLGRSASFTGSHIIQSQGTGNETLRIAGGTDTNAKGLQIRTGGAAGAGVSTQIPFQVSNSANTADYFVMRADGSIMSYDNNNVLQFQKASTGAITAGPSSGLTASHTIQNSSTGNAALIVQAGTSASATGMRVLSGNNTAGQVVFQAANSANTLDYFVVKPDFTTITGNSATADLVLSRLTTSAGATAISGSGDGSGGSMTFYTGTAATPKSTSVGGFNTSGNWTLGNSGNTSNHTINGKLILSASGNTAIDVFAEGTYSGTAAVTSGTATLTLQTGFWYRIGSKVTMWARFVATSVTGGPISPNFTFTLPVTPSTFSATAETARGQLSGFANVEGTTVALGGNTSNTNGISVQTASINTNFGITIHCSYRI